MANSPLVSVRKLSPNCTKPRNHSIDRLTTHHTAGVLSVESALDWFAKESTQASCNYVIGNDFTAQADRRDFTAINYKVPSAN